MESLCVVYSHRHAQDKKYDDTMIKQWRLDYDLQCEIHTKQPKGLRRPCKMHLASEKNRISL